MHILALAAGLLISLTIAVSILTASGKKRLRLTVVRLEKERDEATSRLHLAQRHHKSIEGTRQMLVRRIEDKKLEKERLAIELEKLEELEAEMKRKPAEGEEEQVAEGEAAVGAEEGGAEAEAEADEQDKGDRKIKTRFPAETKGGLF